MSLAYRLRQTTEDYQQRFRISLLSSTIREIASAAL